MLRKISKIDYSSTMVFVDTNILLAPLKVIDDITIDDLLFTFYPFKNSVVIPGHVFDEFQRNFDNVFEKSKDSINNSKTTIDHHYNEIKKSLRVVGSSLSYVIDRQQKRMIQEVDDCQTFQLKKLKSTAKRMEEYIPIVFDKQTNDDYSIKEKFVLMAEYDARCKRQIAPGYKDAAKDGENDYGDLLIWQEILDYMQERSKDDYYDAVFVTNDCKPDWRGEKSEKQLQNEYSEYVYDGQFQVMSLKEFQDLNKGRITRFKSWYNRLQRIIEKDSWGKEDFDVFILLLEKMKATFFFLLAMIPQNKLDRLRNLLNPYQKAFLQLGVDFIEFTPRGKAVLRNAKVSNLHDLLYCSLSELVRSKQIGKRGFAEISEKRSNLNRALGPFVLELV